MGHLPGYARVPITDQQPHLQVDAQERAGSYRVFTETAAAPAPGGASHHRTSEGM